jgi:hypothetical protein
LALVRSISCDLGVLIRERAGEHRQRVSDFAYVPKSLNLHASVLGLMAVWAVLGTPTASLAVQPQEGENSVQN